MTKKKVTKTAPKPDVVGELREANRLSSIACSAVGAMRGDIRNIQYQLEQNSHSFWAGFLAGGAVFSVIVASILLVLR